jgi:hypothetical protein
MRSTHGFRLGVLLAAGAWATVVAPPAAHAGEPVALEQGRSPEETYALNALDLVHQRITKVTLLGIGIVKADSWRPVRGKYRWRMSRQEFFLHVGRRDLAEQQSSTDTWSDVLFYGGFAVTLSGVLYPFLTRNEDGGIQSEGLLIGGALFLGGLVMSNVGAAFSGPVVDAKAASSLALRYNERLAGRLSQAAQSSSSLRLQVGRVSAVQYQLRF